MGIRQEEEQHYSPVDILFLGITYSFYIVLPLALIDLVNLIFKFYPNVSALMIYSVLLYAVIIFPVAYLWAWLNRYKTSREKKEVLKK
jgi:hypothetical protein